MPNDNNNHNQSTTSGFVKFPPPINKSPKKKPSKKVLPKTKQVTNDNLTGQSRPQNNFPFPNDPFGGMGFSNRGGGKMEEKTEMIKKIYKEILGKEPDPRDLSYFRFSPMEEEELREHLLKGEEHKELIKKGNEFKELQEQLDTHKAKVKVLESKIQDQIEEFNQLHNLLKEKNRYIRQLRGNYNIQYGHTNEQQPEPIVNEDISDSEVQNDVDEQKSHDYVAKPQPSNHFQEPAQPQMYQQDSKEVSNNDLEIPETDSLIPPEPPLPHFTNDNDFKKAKRKGVLGNIFRS